MMFFFLPSNIQKFDLRQKFYYSSLNWRNENTHEFSSVCCRQKFASLRENGLKIEAEMKYLNFLCEPMKAIFFFISWYEGLHNPTLLQYKNDFSCLKCHKTVWFSRKHSKKGSRPLNFVICHLFPFICYLFPYLIEIPYN